MINPLSINPKQEKEKIVNFLEKTLRDQKIDKVVLGLSGGIDSTVVLYLLKEALPIKNIFAVQMDYNPREKSSIDLKGINVVNAPIKEIVYKFIKESEDIRFERLGIPPKGEGSHRSEKRGIKLSLSKLRLGNIMARVRMIILFDLAKKYNALVCGTENKSEKLLGYFTRFGDAASDIEPLSHLFKTQVYQLAKYLKVPKKIIQQSPTAGLWNGQTDEDEFGFTYEEADLVLHIYFNKKKKLEEIMRLGYKNSEKIIKFMQNNQFKLKTPYSL